MPATRSRTENWRRSLGQIAERGGSVEITLANRSNELRNSTATDAQPSAAKNLIWRVRIISLERDCIVVERPFALGKEMDLLDGSPIVGLFTVGQNRWMFRTRVVRHSTHKDRGRENDVLVLASPEQVERCQRRNFYRISTLGLELPIVEAFPLLDASSTAVAEAACRQEIEQMIDHGIAGRIGSDASPDAISMPEVGPGIQSRLVNLGGGESASNLESLLPGSQSVPLEGSRVRASAAKTSDTQQRGAEPSLVHFSFTGTESLAARIDRAKQLLRHRFPRGTLEEIFDASIESLLDRCDPSRRIARKALRPAPKKFVRPERDKRSRHIPQAVKEEVWLRDGGQCAFVPAEGDRCTARSWHEYDHIIPWAVGGKSDDAGNIRLLCRNHNQMRVRGVVLT